MALSRSWLKALSLRFLTHHSRPTPRRRKMALRSAELLETRCLLSTAVLTYHNDNQSTGVNSTETLLTASTLDTFQKLTTTAVDGQVYAQPLYVPSLNITRGTMQGVHDTTLIATQHDSLYAIDTQTGAILWQISLTDTTNPKVNLLGASAITSVPSSDTGSDDINPEIGVTATPVIDGATNLMYVEAKSKATVKNDTHYVHTLYKVDIAAGVIVSSVIIGDTIFNGGGYVYRITNTGTGTDPFVVGTGDGAILVNGQSRVYFNALREMDRPGLVLTNGHVVLSYASHGDNGPYHGWVLMYSANNLVIQGAFNTTPNGGLGGIWQGGGIPAVDAQGNLYFETGNGTLDYNNGIPMTPGGFQAKGDYGDCFLKIGLDPASTQNNQNGNLNGWGLKLIDYFSPYNNLALDQVDADLGSGGVTVLPDSAGSAAHPHLLIGAGKEGKLYLIDRDNMGKFDPQKDNVVQTVAGGVGGSFNTPGYFNGNLYYFPGYSGPGYAYTLTNATIGANRQQTPDNFGGYNLTGTPSISANGTANGLVWVLDRTSNQLRAYSAVDLSKEVWTSSQAANNRDQPGTVIKFSVPTVADGHVIVGTTNSVVIYGRPGGTPVLANIELDTLNYLEKATTQISNTITVSETGSPFLDYASVQVTGHFQPQDILVFSNTPKITGVWDDSTGILTLRGQATPAEYQAALRSVAYRNRQWNPSTLVRTVTFVAGSAMSSNPQSRDISITPANDPPVIVIDSGPLQYIRRSTTPISPNLLVTDPDSDLLPSATVQISGNFQSSEDYLIFSDTINIKGTWDPTTGTMTLNGWDTVSNYRAALQSVSFFDIRSVPNTLTRTVSFQTTDGDLSSNLATREINVIRVNNPPLLSALETTPLAYTQTSAATLVTQTLLVSDPDNDTLPSATVTISAGYLSSSDVLSFVDTAKIKGAWNASTGTLTLTGTDTVSNYRSALRTVRFAASNSVAGNSSRTISFQATDGQSVSNVVSRTVVITGVPSLSGIETGSLAYTVANAALPITSTLLTTVYDSGKITGATVHIINVQSGDQLASSSLAGVTSSWNASTGTLTFSGASSAANYQGLLRSVTYRNPSSSPSTLRRQIQFQVFEGVFQSNVVTRNINFTTSSNQPELSNIETVPLAYIANSPAKSISLSIIAFDPDQLTLVSALIQITGNYRVGQDVLGFIDTPTIKATWTPSTGRLFLQGVDTVANYQAALRAVTYINIATRPSPITRTVSFRVSNGAVANAWNSNTVSRDITIN